MKRPDTIFLLFASLLILTACGEDRTYQYLELTKENQWIYAEMQNNYLWNDSIKKPERNKFFQESEDFFKGLLVKEDKSSYFTDSASLTSYGISFAVMRDPLGIKTSKCYALTLFVAPGSPAHKAGLKRGTWITAVGKSDITTSNYSILENGTHTTLSTSRIAINDEDNSYYWTEGDSLTMEQAVELEETILYLDTIYNIPNRKVGYIVYNRFETENDANGIYNAFKRMNDAGITDLILDLRYNHGGSLETAARVASCLVPPTATQDIFCEIKRNDSNSDKNSTYMFTEESSRLDAENIYILTTKATSGTAEAFIAAMQNTLGSGRVKVLGSGTAGNNMYNETLQSPFNFTINPVTGNLYTSDGNILSPYGIHPNYAVDELSQLYTVYPLGEQQEYMLYSTIYLITNGTLPQPQSDINVSIKKIINKGGNGKSIVR